MLQGRNTCSDGTQIPSQSPCPKHTYVVLTQKPQGSCWTWVGSCPPAQDLLTMPHLIQRESQSPTISHNVLNGMALSSDPLYFSPSLTPTPFPLAWKCQHSPATGLVHHHSSWTSWAQASQLFLLLLQISTISSWWSLPRPICLDVQLPLWGPNYFKFSFSALFVLCSLDCTHIYYIYCLLVSLKCNFHGDMKFVCLFIKTQWLNSLKIKLKWNEFCISKAVSYI